MFFISSYVAIVGEKYDLMVISAVSTHSKSSRTHYSQQQMACNTQLHGDKCRMRYSSCSCSRLLVRGDDMNTLCWRMDAYVRIRTPLGSRVHMQPFFYHIRFTSANTRENVLISGCAWRNSCGIESDSTRVSTSSHIPTNSYSSLSTVLPRLMKH